MKRRSAWYPAVFLFFLVAGCAGDGSEGDMGEMAEMNEADDMMMADLSCSVMGDLEGRASPMQEVRFSAGGGDALLCYGAPSANGREIMGGLVPYGEPWRLGANEPTTLHLSMAATVGDVSLDAGSYSIYAMPGESEWMFHINTNADRWGIPIDADVMAADVGTFTVASSATMEMVEMLTFEHMDGMLRLMWENTQVDIPIGM